MPEMMWDMVSLSRLKGCPLAHPGLLLLLQHEVKDLQTLCSLLQTAKATHEAAFAHCCGSVPMQCRPGELLVAAQGADSICICCSHCHPDPLW
jgi:hypothetical protein